MFWFGIMVLTPQRALTGSSYDGGRRTLPSSVFRPRSFVLRHNGRLTAKYLQGGAHHWIVDGHSGGVRSLILLRGATVNAHIGSDDPRPHVLDGAPLGLIQDQANVKC